MKKGNWGRSYVVEVPGAKLEGGAPCQLTISATSAEWAKHLGKEIFEQLLGDKPIKSITVTPKSH